MTWSPFHQMTTSSINNSTFWRWHWNTVKVTNTGMNRQSSMEVIIMQSLTAMSTESLPPWGFCHGWPATKYQLIHKTQNQIIFCAHNFIYIKINGCSSTKSLPNFYPPPSPTIVNKYRASVSDVYVQHAIQPFSSTKNTFTKQFSYCTTIMWWGTEIALYIYIYNDV